MSFLPLLPVLAAAAGSICEVLDLDSRYCKCTDMAGQQILADCEVPLKIAALNFSDSFGAKILASPCTDPASLSIDVVERDLAIDVPIEKIVAGTELLVPIPGLSFNLPDVGQVGLDVDIALHGDIDELSVKIGLNACVAAGGTQMCGQDIPGLDNVLPIWIVNGDYSFGHVCEQ